jgi:hypothetical protein
MANNSSLIQIDTSKLDKIATEFIGFEYQVSKAAARTLRKTLDSTLAKTAKYVSEEYKIKQKDVKETFKNGKKYPTDGKLEASLTSTGHRLSFAHFPFKPNNDKRAKKGESIFKSAVFVTIKASKGPILSRKGFVATTGAKSADKVQFNVFRRLGKERFPIAPIRTLSIPQMITNQKIGDRVSEFATKKFEGIIEHEILYELDKLGEKIR